MSRAAKVNSEGIAIDVIVVSGFIPEGYRSCNPWIGVGVPIDSPEPSPPSPPVPQSISPMQGILTLGKEAWDKVLAYRVTASWQEQVVIDSAQDWHRNSQNIAFFGYLLGYSDTQMDDMFRAAAAVSA